MNDPNNESHHDENGEAEPASEKEITEATWDASTWDEVGNAWVKGGNHE